MDFQAFSRKNQVKTGAFSPSKVKTTNSVRSSKKKLYLN